MNEFDIGRIIGELTCRLSALEEKVSTLESTSCDCDDTVEMTARLLSDEELTKEEKQQVNYCLFVVAGYHGPPCPSIRINHTLCIRPCPPCSTGRYRIRLLDAQGNHMCTVFGSSVGKCHGCPTVDSHKFVWV